MTCPPCNHDCDQGDTCPIRVKERERIIAANAPELEKVNAHIKRLEDRTWVGLTEEDLKLLSAEWRIVYGAWMDDFARAIEAKLREKNA